MGRTYQRRFDEPCALTGFGADCGGLGQQWIYLIPLVIGTVLGGIDYDLIREPRPETASTP